MMTPADLLARDERLRHLSRIGARGWYADHVNRGQCGRDCTCDGPDQRCDVGVALHRLATRKPGDL